MMVVGACIFLVTATQILHTANQKNGSFDGVHNYLPNTQQYTTSISTTIFAKKHTFNPFHPINTLII